MADVKENAMVEVENPKYLRCLDTEGNSKNILLSTLLSNVVRNVGNLRENDLKNIGTCVGYSFGTMDGSGIYGLFLSIESGGYYMQLKSSFSGGVLKFRTYNKEDDVWSDWNKIAFT